MVTIINIRKDMTQKEKQLLLKDLCARLPYVVKVQCDRYPRPVTVLYAGNINEVKFAETGGIEHIESIKPYLRPMSSMTEEEKRTYLTLRAHALPFSIVEWLDEKHFDHRTNMDGEHLIEIGLALEAPEGMYKTE